MGTWKLLTFTTGDYPRAGIKAGERIYDAAALLGAQEGSLSVLDILNDWDRKRAAIEKAAEAPSGKGYADNEVRLLAPVLFPSVYYCAASNFYDHSKEMRPDRNVTRDGKQPYFFIKPGVHTTVGPGEKIRVPGVTQKLDWELEIGAVIGKPAFNVPVERALDYVAGYTLCNDLSARDLGKREDWHFGADWFGQKVFEGAMPQGPWIVPTDQVGDPQVLDMKLWVNDTLMQNSNSRNMVFNIAEQVEYLSRRMILRPGDIIATGTPSGVGAPRGIFLKAGDSIRMEVEKIGSMTNSFV
jgi:2-keto-4-pentenoate hydratase/2-oxohepta-3-ene-1,7-dioic acid hydratase in catechol pathway